MKINKSKILISFFTSILLMLSSLITTSQNSSEFKKCATIITDKQKLEFESWIENKTKFINYQKKLAAITNIQVVFHVLHTGQAVGAGVNISQWQISSQMIALNQAFRKQGTLYNNWVSNTTFSNSAADCEIEFCLAKFDPSGNLLAESGIDRINVTTKGWPLPPYAPSSIELEQTIKPASIWDPTKYLNIWVVNFSDNTLGYAQFPTVPAGTPTIGDLTNAGLSGDSNTDGLVIVYNCIGYSGNIHPQYNKGATLIHELGHWLGVYHIWGDDNGSCNGTDYVNDTPNQASNTTNCPNQRGKKVIDKCTSTDQGINYQNFMDYTLDSCLAMFTQGQKERMMATLTYCNNRKTLTKYVQCGQIGITQIDNLAQAIYIFPNPAKYEIKIQGLNTMPTNVQIKIYNVLGEVILTQQEVNEHQNSIDVSTLSNGVYLIEIKVATQIITKKLVIQ